MSNRPEKFDEDKARHGIGGNGPPADGTPIHRKVGGHLMLYALPQMTQLVWIVMHEMAIMSRGQRYWRTRRATLDTLEELLGRRPTPKTVTTAWQNLERAGMISHVGTLENGTKVWQMNDDAALGEYARLERIVKSTAGTPLRFAG